MGVVLGILPSLAVVHGYDIFGGLGVCYDLVFYVHLLGCLV